jgi:membrane associated rhomboid family serine protease
MKKPGLRRFPLVTTAVFGLTAAVNLLQFVVDGLLRHLERSPAGLHGDWWRTVTALFTQDGGVAGTLSNLVFLVVIGVFAEQVVSRPRWLLCYFGTGLVGEFAGYGWQPYGAGNSVAICGLAGVVAVALWSADERLPSFGPAILVFWCGALLSNLWYPLAAAGAVAGWLTMAGRERGVPVARWAVLAASVTGVVMTAAEDIHGAALLAGLALASLLMPTGRRPSPRDPAAGGDHGGGAGGGFRGVAGADREFRSQG